MTNLTNIATETIIYEKQAVMRAWGILFTTRLFKADRMINLRLLFLGWVFGSVLFSGSPDHRLT